MTRHCRDVQKNCSWGAAIKRNQCPGTRPMQKSSPVSGVRQSQSMERYSLMHRCLLYGLRPQSFPHWRTPQRKLLTMTGGIILTCLDARLLTDGTVMVQGFGANEEKALLEQVEAPIPVGTHPSYHLGSSGLLRSRLCRSSTGRKEYKGNKFYCP
jgi:hypothetical protein